MRKLSKIVFIVVLAVVVIAAFTACKGDEVTSPIDIVVTFDSSGGSEVPSVTVEKDGIIKLPAAPTKEGYSFGGWYVDKETTTAFVSSGKIPASITVYAKWLKVYAVTFASGAGATGTAPTIAKQVEGASITLPENTFTKANYTFAGWSDGSTTKNAGASYIIGTENVTFTATWTENAKYTVTFASGEGATGTAPTMAGQYEGAEITLPENTFTKANYTFAGWSDGSTTKNAGASYIIGTEDVTFTATWTENAKYSVSFASGEGATGTAPTENSQYEGVEITLPENTFEKEGYGFAGWSDGTTEYQANASYIMKAQAVIFTAVWAKTYVVTFASGEGATGTAPTMAEQFEGAEITLPENSFTKANYTFAGWSDGSTTKNAGASYVIGTQNVTFTATWTENVKYTVTFLGGESATGTAPAENSQYEGAEIILPENSFTKANYTFAGWSDGSTTKNAGESYVIGTQNVTFTATWTENAKYTVTFASGEGATGTAPTMAGQYEGAEITLPENTFEKEGCVFKSWFDGTTEYQADASYVMGAQAVTFTATWLTISTNILYELSDDGTSYYVFGYEGRLTEAVIASTYNGLPVTSIGRGAFSGCIGLNAVTIPSSVTRIGEYAFSGCFGLNAITIPSTVESIGEGVFSGCFGLTAVTIPSSVTSIGGYAFSGCIGLNAVTIPSSVTSISESVFEECVKLVQITNLSGLTLSGLLNNPEQEIRTDLDTPFENTLSTDSDGIMTYTVGETVYCIGYTGSETELDLSGKGITAIYQYALYTCQTLNTITIPSSVTSIGDLAFGEYLRLVQITNLSGLTLSSEVLPNVPGQEIRTDLDTPFENTLSTDSAGITTYTVGEGEIVYCFSYTGNEATLDLSGKGITAIYQSAFENNETLTSITIPSSVTSIGDFAFYCCFRLTGITIPSSVESIGDCAFCNCIGLTTVTFGENSQLTSMGDSAFEYCEKLTGITIPSSVNSIGNAAFYYCYGLTTVTFGENSQLTSIGDSAFLGCTEFTGIIIPSSVNSIGNEAFEYCDGLTTVTFGENSQLTSIGDSAFEYCEKLTGITIPSGVESIGERAFGGCSALTSITVEEGNEKYHSTTDCLIETATKTLILGCNNSIIPTDGSVESIGDYAFEDCAGLTSITIPFSVTSIGSGAFNGCYTLVQITNLSGQELSGLNDNPEQEIRTDLDTPFENTLSTDSDGIITFTVGETVYCIGYTGSETELDLSGKGITAIYQYAFYNNKTLTTITIPSSVTSIGDCAFLGCTGLTTITIPSSVTSIGDHAFEETAWYENQPDGLVYAGKVVYGYKGTMPSGTAITLREDTVGIADCAFSYCTELTSITIPSSVASIGGYAFDGCFKLVQITNLSGLPLGVLPTSPGREIRTDLDTPFVNTLSTDSDGIMTFTVGETVYCISYTGIEKDVDLSGKGITAIYKYAFYNNRVFSSITIPSSVTSIGNSAFYGTAWYENQPDGVVYVGKIAYGYKGTMPANTAVAFREDTTGVADNAFTATEGIVSITIPSSMTSIGDYAFCWCTELTTVTFGENSQLISMGDSVFERCDKLTTITIPSSVTSIGRYVFYSCTSLNTVSFGENSQLTSIGEGAFKDCDGLTTITLPSSVTSMGAQAFKGCYGLTTINYGGTTAQWNAIEKGTSWDDNTGSYTIYYGCNENVMNPVTFVLGEGVTGTTPTISEQYEGARIILPEKNFEKEGCIFKAWFDGTTEYQENASYVMGAQAVTFTATWLTFSTNLSYTLSGDETSYAVSGYEGQLTEAVIPPTYNGLPVTSIEPYVFSSCTELSYIYIPSSVTSIEYSAFEGCFKLVQITNLSGQELSELPINPGQKIRTDLDTPFENTLSTDSDGIITFTVGETVYCIGYTGSETELDLSDKGITAIYQYAFEGNETLTSITLPFGVESIGERAFSSCTVLATITIPTSVTSIGNAAFNGTAWYENQPDGVVYVGKVAYKYKGIMPNNTAITLREDTIGVADNSFTIQNGLTSITLPSSVTRIGNAAFSLGGLTTINIPSSVMSIGNTAFSSCEALTTINYGGTTAQWNAMEKGEYWNSYTGTYTVYCTDGNITK